MRLFIFSMTRLHKYLTVFIASLLLIAGIAILLTTGLPLRTDYTGFIIEGEGIVAPERNAIAPRFSNPSLTTDNFQLMDLRGQVVILNFWATWCGPCRAEMPILQTLHEEYANQNVRIVAVNIGESRPIVEQWVNEMGLTFDIILDEQGDVVASYQLRGEPSTFIISPEGIITDVFYGAVSENTLRNRIELLMEKS